MFTSVGRFTQTSERNGIFFRTADSLPTHTDLTLLRDFSSPKYHMFLFLLGMILNIFDALDKK